MLPLLLTSWAMVAGMMSDNWDPSMIRSLGCYMTFDSSQIAIGSISGYSVGLRSCAACTEASFVLLRGRQCLCLTGQEVGGALERVMDEYCNVQCDERIEPAMLCGGNLGGNLYCDSNKEDCQAFPLLPEPRIDPVYSQRVKKMMNESCLELGCGKPHLNGSIHLVYFPNLQPEDCATFCYHQHTSYAHVGWIRRNDPRYSWIPTCACANATVRLNDSRSCRQGCPDPLNSLPHANQLTSYPSCGSQELNSWAVFCTTGAMASYCKPYKPMDPNPNGPPCPQPTLNLPFQRASLEELMVEASSCSCNISSSTRRSLLEDLDPGYVPKCDHGNCGEGSCYFNGSCYNLAEIFPDTTEDAGARRNRSTIDCQTRFNSSEAHLLAIETKEEQGFIATVFRDRESCYLTSGIITGVQNQAPYWDLPDGPVDINMSDVKSNWNVTVEDNCNAPLTYPQSLYLAFNNNSGTNDIWHFSNNIGIWAICEFSAPPESSSSTTSSTAISTTRISTTASIPKRSTTAKPTTTQAPSRDHCPCMKEDQYHTKWIIPANETHIQPCREGASGNASWSCDYVNGKCQLRTSQPDYSECHSEEIDRILDEVESNDTLDFMKMWMTIDEFTFPEDKYFGHEIDDILDLVTQLMDRQDEDLATLEDHLEFQINTTKLATEIIDHLITHDVQWDQLSQDHQSMFALFLLNVSEDVGFRLSNVAQLGNRPLHCETYQPNVTISSSYWDGMSSLVQDCGLADNLSREAFLRFPMMTSSSSYLILPDAIIESGKIHKAAGTLITSSIVNQLFPGTNNPSGNPKKINSPLISYTLYDPKSKGMPEEKSIPDGSYIQLVYQHSMEAKFPPVKTLRRWLDPGEVPSAVIGSSFCAYLLLNETGNQSSHWKWDGRGCSVDSTNRTHTVCRCNHLTGFANLMDFHDYIGPSKSLNVTSAICSALSVISLVIAFTILTVLRSVKTDRTVITQNLCITLMASHLLILTTLNKHLFHLDDETCAVMGILLHFSLLASFMWMGVEGLRLFRMVVYVFNLKSWNLYYVLASYIVPCLIVGITVLVAHFTVGIIPAYVGDETCWLSGENFMWSFVGPVAVIMLANLGFIAVAVHSSWNLKQNTDRSFSEKIGNAAAMSLSLSCLLGLSWLSGFLLYAEPIFFAYLFTVTNGLQGVTILLFRCVLNDEIRTAVVDRYKRRRNTRRLGRSTSTVTRTTISQRRRSELEDTSSKLKLRTDRQSVSSSGIISSDNSTEQLWNYKASGKATATNQQQPRRYPVIRTISGTEFSDDFSSDDRRMSLSSIGSSAFQGPGQFRSRRNIPQD